MFDKSKIGLGTVQFGIPYGISNQKGQTSSGEVEKILIAAQQLGIEIIDTASAYGTSEKVLGNNNLESFKIVSKFMSNENSLSISEQLKMSLNLLKVSSVYGYLAHRSLDVIANPKQWDELKYLRKAGLIAKIGFSFNEPSEIEKVLEKGWIPDLIQVPFNYFDKRFKPYLIELKILGCEVHTRSTFLQGLFFMPTNQLSSFFDSVKPYIRVLQEKGNCLSGLLLKYALQQEFIDKVIIGVNNSKQLLTNLEMITTTDNLPEFLISVSDNILIPSKWRK